MYSQISTQAQSSRFKLGNIDSTGHKTDKHISAKRKRMSDSGDLSGRRLFEGESSHSDGASGDQRPPTNKRQRLDNSEDGMSIGDQLDSGKPIQKSFMLTQ